MTDGPRDGRGKCLPAAGIAVLLLSLALTSCAREPGDVDETADRVADIPGVVAADADWEKGPSWKVHDEGVVAVAIGADPDPAGLADLVSEVYDVTDGVDWCTRVAFVAADKPDASAYIAFPGSKVDRQRASSLVTGEQPDPETDTARLLKTIVDAGRATGSSVQGHPIGSNLAITMLDAGAAADWPAVLSRLAAVEQPSSVSWTVSGEDFSFNLDAAIAKSTAVRWDEFMAGLTDLPEVKVTAREGNGQYFTVTYQADDARAATRVLTKKVGPAARRLAARAGVDSVTVNVTDGTSQYDAWWGRGSQTPGRWHQR
ncbi:hypothetical protein [Nocardioides speluncae]|uniref:hypothetical protein n=1 Tax=Nocardioides speluncae TaxID=2670337 RepID=UPI000D695D5F|nr:hypothetical protein [Nocardioides speluncae]